LNKRLFALILLVSIAGTALSPALADCIGPAAVEGKIIYNAGHKTMQFCDGTDWWAMKGVAVDLPSCAEGDGIVMSSAGWDCTPGGSP
jgi:hypothetical protein